MSKGNPMCIKYYSYKVEFALRGAAHIHGVLWIDWKNFDSMERKKTVYVIEALEKIRNETSLGPENIQYLNIYNYYYGKPQGPPAPCKIYTATIALHYTKCCASIAHHFDL